MSAELLSRTHISVPLWEYYDKAIYLEKILIALRKTCETASQSIRDDLKAQLYILYFFQLLQTRKQTEQMQIYILQQPALIK